MQKNFMVQGAVFRLLLGRSVAFPAEVRQAVDWAKTTIGTAEPGLRCMIFPGAAMPFGMVKLSPDKRGLSNSGRASWRAHGPRYGRGTNA